MGPVKVWPCGTVQRADDDGDYSWLSDDYLLVPDGAPHAAFHDSRPEYLAELLDTARLSQTAAAEMLGISPRQMRRYLAAEGTAAHTPAPYTVQYALEVLARR